jgi:hypothetical protein
MQFAEQPSPGTLLASSHCSPGSGIPLPQFGSWAEADASAIANTITAIAKIKVRIFFMVLPLGK